MEKYDIEECITEAEEIEKGYRAFIDSCEEGFTSRNYTSSRIMILGKNSKDLQRQIMRKYEVWFSVCKLIVRQYSDKKEEFEDMYDEIKSSVMIESEDSKKNHLENFLDNFDEQTNILHATLPLITLKKKNFKKIITADLLESELEQAEILYNYQFHRAAGAIAGVVLERFLKTLCNLNQISISDTDTIDPLATKIYTSKKITGFDTVFLKAVQHLASIRNKCTHPKEEPSPSEIRELLDKTKKIVFMGL